MTTTTDITHDQSIREEVRNCHTTERGMSDEEFSMWAFNKIIDIDGVNRPKDKVERMIRNLRELLEKEVVDLIEDVNRLYWEDGDEERQRQYEDMKNNDHGRVTEQEVDDLLDECSSGSDDDVTASDDDE